MKNLDQQYKQAKQDVLDLLSLGYEESKEKQRERMSHDQAFCHMVEKFTHMRLQQQGRG